MSGTASLESLRELIMRAVPEPAFRTFAEVFERCQPNWPLHQFLAAFTATARTLGREPLDLAGSGISAVSVALAPTGAHTTDPARGLDRLPINGITSDVAGRALLLHALASAAPQKLEEAVAAAYDNGDALEKLAVVRSLSLLPQAERFTRIALDAGRNNEVDLVHALACHNPFPAQHYDELAWNKLYMKAAFLALPLQDIMGLEQRANAELSRMALHYVEQQESAVRAFPGELWLAIAHFPPPGAAAKLLGYASHATAEQRLGAAIALEHLQQPRTAVFLSERLPVETDERVRTVLARTLAALAH
jgi:hypothetical protein